MPRFRIKDLLLAVLAISFGAAMLRTAYTDRVPAQSVLLVPVILGGFMLIGVGLGIPFNRPWTGALIVAVIVFLMSLFAMLLG